MEDKSSPDGFLVTEGSYKRVLMNWLIANADLQSNYNRLVNYLNGYRARRLPGSDHSYANQCVIVQLVSLVHSMRQEMERLVADVDQYHEPKPVDLPRYCTKLVEHTRVISELNKQASTLLKGVTLPLPRQ